MLRSYTLLALSFCFVASASASLWNHNTHASRAKDGRVFVTLVNTGVTFRDVEIAGRSYTVMPHQVITVKAPVGTVVYSASSLGKIHRGDALMELTASMDKRHVEIK